MDSKQTMVAFGGLALIGFHFWTGPQRPGLRVLWGGPAPYKNAKGTVEAILPPTLFGLPGSPPSDPTLGGILPAPAIAPGQKPSTLPYGPHSAGRM